MSNITVLVKLFAVYQEVCQRDEIALSLPSATPVRGILERLLEAHPELEPWQSLTRFGVNHQFVEPDTPLQEGDEVVLIPPVSGG